jgi:cellulose synthase operon protein C
MQKDLLLITDDMPTRAFGRRFGAERSSWLQPVFMVANNRGKIDFDTYVRWTANLIDAAHNYVCVSGKALIHAASIDEQAGACPGYFFNQTTNMIGGAAAEPASHIRVVVEFLQHVWNDPSALGYRERATGFLLEQLIRERTVDYGRILRTVMWRVRHLPELIAYLSAWLRGHFLEVAA